MRGSPISGLTVFVSGAVLTTGIANADVLHENGDASGIGGRSNATVEVFGARRTLLDDFVVPENEIWRIEALHHHHAWNTMPAGSGTGMEIAIWTDAGCRPGELDFDLVVTGYQEEATGRTFFSRAEAESWTTFEPVELLPGHYWFEATVVGPENNFWLLNEEVIFGEAWVNYSDLGGLKSGTDQFGDAWDLAWRLEGTVVDTIDFEYTNGRPAFIRPCGDTTRVEITPPAGSTLDVQSPMLHYDAGAGFVTVPLDRVSFVVYDVVFPAIGCGTGVRYYLAAATTDGETFTDPIDAPAATYLTTTATDVAIVVDDDMESDAGWTVENIDVVEGAWERGVPPGGNWREPDHDGDGSGQCWVTGLATHDDLDGGPTRLITPVIDLEGSDDAIVTFAAWMLSTNGVPDTLHVDISNDDGASWTAVQDVEYCQRWQEQRFRAADFITPLTGQMRLRFSISDQPNNSFTEAGIDALRIVEITCNVGFPGDVDRDGDVDFADLLALLAAWGECPPGGPCPADLDVDGDVDFADLLLLLAAWAPCA